MSYDLYPACIHQGDLTPESFGSEVDEICEEIRAGTHAREVSGFLPLCLLVAAKYLSVSQPLTFSFAPFTITACKGWGYDQK